MAADDVSALAVAALACTLTLIVCFMCVELYHLRGPKSESLAGPARGPPAPNRAPSARA
jgi:hypothetical protein